MTSRLRVIKIDNALVVYRFTGNVMTSIITLRKIREHLNVFTPKLQFLSVYCNVITFVLRERSGSAVECLTRDRRAAGSSLTGVTAMCP